MSTNFAAIQSEFDASTGAALKDLGAILTKFGVDVAAAVAAAQARPIAAAADDEKIALDNALFDSAPVATVPAHAEFAPLQDIGHRFLIAAEGMFIEIRRPWLHLIQQISTIEGATRPPYGKIEPKMEFAFGRLGAAQHLFRRFGEEANSASPNEHAAWIIWNDRDRQLEYKPVSIKSATPDSLDIDRPALAAHESLVVDLHSHGIDPAFFSPTDDADDIGEVKISGVIGGLAAGTEKTVVFRLCALGRPVHLKVPVTAFFPATEPAEATA
ncbi:PRTRC system protein A [Burkholderia glumae]|uniref:PRTRC system protein A n=1 Tax=Burkholderia glumae TaxID=337 RepID=A0ABY5B6W1_BURGL|nr:PRTRC system protein A [Burkholderia glumae]USS42782.1 PRTRC system protein A [Burkholderia glumae]